MSARRLSQRKRRDVFRRECEKAAQRGYHVDADTTPAGERARVTVARDAAILMMGIYDPDEPFREAANRWGPKALPAGGLYGDGGLSRRALHALRCSLKAYSEALLWAVLAFRDRRSFLSREQRLTEFKALLQGFDRGEYSERAYREARHRQAVLLALAGYR